MSGSPTRATSASAASPGPSAPWPRASGRSCRSTSSRSPELLLLRLAGPGDGVEVVRRRVPIAEIEALSLPGLRRVLDRLAEARLLTIGDAHVEVAHEALFREWPRLRGWLTDDAAGRAVQRRLALAASEWAAEGREPGALWRGTQLLAGLEIAGSRPEEVTPLEQAFLDAGRDVADAEERAVRERAAATARQNRRLRWLLAGAAVLLAATLVAGVLAVRARGEAEESATACRDLGGVRRRPTARRQRPQRGPTRARPAPGARGDPARAEPRDVRRAADAADAESRHRDPVPDPGPPPPGASKRRRERGLPVGQHQSAVRRRRALRGAAVDRGEPRGRCPVGHGRRRPSWPLARGAADR